MDAVLRNFKSIPCPSGDSCTTPGCQWQHSWDMISTTNAPKETQRHGPVKVREDGTEFGWEDHSPQQHPKVASSFGQRISPTQSQPATVKRPVSPPPLKRKLSAAHPSPIEFSPPTKKPRTAVPPTASPRSLSADRKQPRSASSGTHPLSTLSTEALKTPSISKQNKTTSSTPPATSAQITSASASPNAPSPQKPKTTTKTATRPTTSRPASTEKKAPARKAESLNPRHLKSSAPATHEVRVKLLTLLHEQLVRLNTELAKSTDPDDKKLVLSAQGLIWLALDKEEKFATDKPSVYKGQISNQITRYKKYSLVDWKKERVEEKMRTLQAKTTDQSVNQSALGPPVKISTGLDPIQECQVLQHLLTPLKDLAQYGYVTKPPTDEEIAKARAGIEAAEGWEQCDRCTTRFQVFPGRREDGELTSGGQCTYHPGRTYYTERSIGQYGPTEKLFKCCGAGMGEKGCATAKHHVFKASAPSRLAAVVPFVRTPPNEGICPDRALSFDCEMGYTSRGMELIRLTVVRFPEGTEILDVLVQPVGEVLDLNSRFSGVLPEHLRDAVRVDDPIEAGRQIKKLEEKYGAAAAGIVAGVGAAKAQVHGAGVKDGSRSMKKRMQLVSSPMVARELLFSMISPETPLIGHGLENDLNAVRVVHPTVIDTIILYPHPKGLPMRIGLKALAREHLNREIQGGGVGVVGHDSGEDARAAGDLVRLKVAKRWKELQAKGWKIGDDGRIEQPDQPTSRRHGRSPTT